MSRESNSVAHSWEHGSIDSSGQWICFILMSCKTVRDSLNRNNLYVCRGIQFGMHIRCIWSICTLDEMCKAYDQLTKCAAFDQMSMHFAKCMCIFAKCTLRLINYSQMCCSWVNAQCIWPVMLGLSLTSANYHLRVSRSLYHLLLYDRCSSRLW